VRIAFGKILNSYDKNIKNKSYEIKMLLNLYFIAFVLKVVFIIVFFGLWIFFCDFKYQKYYTKGC